MAYIILKGLFEPDSVSHFAGSLIYIILSGIIIYRLFSELIYDFKKQGKTLINELGLFNTISLLILFVITDLIGIIIIMYGFFIIYVLLC